MTLQEAIENLKDLEKQLRMDDVLQRRDTYTFEVAIEVLEKQIPMKPIELDHDEWFGSYHTRQGCPSCGCGLFGKKFCSDCGQRILTESMRIK